MIIQTLVQEMDKMNRRRGESKNIKKESTQKKKEMDKRNMKGLTQGSTSWCCLFLPAAAFAKVHPHILLFSRAQTLTTCSQHTFPALFSLLAPAG